MNTLKSLFDRDMLRTAVTVIPATALWIASESTIIAAGVGAASFLTLEYGYPAYREGRLSVRPLVDMYTTVRDMIRSKMIKSV